MLQIKYSTGKTLIQLYRKTGRIDRLKNFSERKFSATDVQRKQIRESVVNEVMQNPGHLDPNTCGFANSLFRSTVRAVKEEVAHIKLHSSEAMDVKRFDSEN